MFPINRSTLTQITNEWVDNLQTNSHKGDRTIYRETTQAMRLSNWMESQRIPELDQESFDRFTQSIRSESERHRVTSIMVRIFLGYAADYPELKSIIEKANQDSVDGSLTDDEFNKALTYARNRESRLLLWLSRDTNLTFGRMSKLTVAELEKIDLSPEAKKEADEMIKYRKNYSGLLNDAEKIFVFPSKSLYIPKSQSGTRFLVSESLRKAGLMGVSRQQIRKADYKPVQLDASNVITTLTDDIFQTMWGNADPEERLIMDLLSHNKLTFPALSLLEKKDLKDLVVNEEMVHEFKDYVSKLPNQPGDGYKLLFYNYEMNRKPSKVYVDERIQDLAKRCGIAKRIQGKAFHRAESMAAVSQAGSFSDVSIDLVESTPLALEQRSHSVPRSACYKTPYYFDEADYEKLIQACSSDEERLLITLMREGAVSPTTRRGKCRIKNILPQSISEPTMKLFVKCYPSPTEDTVLFDGIDLKWGSWVEQICVKAQIDLGKKSVKVDAFRELSKHDRHRVSKKTLRRWIRDIQRL